MALEFLTRDSNLTETERRSRLFETLVSRDIVRNKQILVCLLEEAGSITTNQAEDLANLYYLYRQMGRLSSVSHLAEQAGILNSKVSRYLSSVTFNYQFKNPQSENDLFTPFHEGRSFEPDSWGSGPLLMDLDFLYSILNEANKEEDSYDLRKGPPANRKLPLFLAHFNQATYRIAQFGREYAEAIRDSFNLHVKPLLKPDEMILAEGSKLQGFTIINTSSQETTQLTRH